MNIMGRSRLARVQLIDNVDPPRIVRDNQLGIDVDVGYAKMLETLCRAYKARWHL